MNVLIFYTKLGREFLYRDALVASSPQCGKDAGFKRTPSSARRMSRFFVSLMRLSRVEVLIFERSIKCITLANTFAIAQANN